MKRALKLFLIYLIALVAFVLIGTLFYSFFMNVSGFVYGNEINFLDGVKLSKSFFVVSYCTCFLICPVISYYRVRHSGGLFQALAFVIIGGITWCLLLPGVIQFEKLHYKRVAAAETEYVPLSEGYFREYDGKVYYFISESDAVVIDTSEEGSVDMVSINSNPGILLDLDAYPYREILIRDTFKESGIPLVVDFKVLIRTCFDTFHKGWTYFLGFLSLGLLMCSAYAVSGFFKWRLLNTASIIIVSTFALSINTLFYAGRYSAFKAKAMGVGFIRFFSKYMDEPVLVMMNLILTTIFIVIGLIKYFVGLKKK